MKKLNIKVIIPLAVLLVCMVYACQKDILNRPIQRSLSPNIVANKTGVESLLIGTYSLLDGVGGRGGGINAAGSNWLFGSVAAGDAYKGSEPSDGGNDALPVGNFTLATSNPYITSKYTLCFDGVARANDVLRTLALAKDIGADDVKRITGEAKFLRAFYYMELKKMYNMIPYVDETATNYNLPNDKDIWPNIEADLQAGIDNIPVSQAQKGRANKWVAVAYLAKAKMFQHKYAEAKALYDNLIPNGVKGDGSKFALNVNFQRNFSPQAAQKNSPESVFAAQASVNDNSGGNNGNTGDELNFPYTGGPGACCGWFNPSQSLANSFKTDASGLPLFTTFNDGQLVSGKTNPYTGTVDPRIDITMGRPNIPYLDWGNPPAAWIRDPTDGVFNPRKNVYSSAEKGTNSSTENYWAANEVTSNNVNLMRWSDVLLMAAEAEVEVGDVGKALDYVNLVRNRAAGSSWWVYKNSAYDPSKSEYTVKTTPADNYLIKPYPAGAFADKNYARKAIHFERKLELAMEGQRFFDLQRWDQGTGSMADEINAFFAYDININLQLKGAHFTKGKNEYYPIPQSEIDLSASTGKGVLKQNPGY
ncbi:RagB/SusD family nutrient uptake outer membrane protein [Mucilaginibacter rubeus]|uniref:RagB/SusD family nutrient uptake outer membrane protein n=1 Tax=Mucilaginibacter rubeus TaxID=2027860 RepID=A0AAE6JGS5_9SPHI|nr:MULTISPECIES: RagB/SusD family nutrient uptake outer membrane protein [Mucilaginibacter]QEM05168.1 RagB/SusD family nutrient uptake outer membrane protein [Mucilaginibacter rubeus]QEM17761.1 RagB/SusD family nutrient uptake outer membrane protein [Mucilaginibacter gossypii]QTE45713.1 RagB/SusD family nutrient uptake outer membrane protein [Mucilaginibacter rubeus]QTE52310.1 RagB/SusD family nutrient uptake outer membrane protein [Mucilaginibacter rubeus]QTE57399.1 RagB/SusD family nutrient 